MDRKALEEMLAKGNDNLLLRYTLGTVCLKEGAVETAAAHLEEALRQDPEHSASWKAYGKALVALNRSEDARTAYTKGITVAEAKGDVQAAKEMKVFLKRLVAE
ncbi:MAG: tetratricopeptide repeat protein [Pseudomonadota bacterium]